MFLDRHNVNFVYGEVRIEKAVTEAEEDKGVSSARSKAVDYKRCTRKKVLCRQVDVAGGAVELALEEGQESRSGLEKEVQRIERKKARARPLRVLACGCPEGC